ASTSPTWKRRWCWPPCSAATASSSCAKTSRSRWRRSGHATACECACTAGPDIDGREWVTFTVSDTGIGMTQEEIARLFRPFVQVDGSTTRKYGGIGLGLVLAQRFCRLLGGDLEVESRPGVGSTFRARLPADAGRAIGDG